MGVSIENDRRIIDYVAAAKTGQSQAQEKLIVFIQNRVFKYIFYLTKGRLEESEDLTQEVLIKVLKNLGQLEDNKNFYSWLYRIAYHQFISARRLKWFKVFSNKLDSVENLPIETEEQMIRSDILETLSRLSLKEQNILLLVDYHGFNYEETSKTLGLKLNTVKSQLSRARAKFRNSWNNEG